MFAYEIEKKEQIVCFLISFKTFLLPRTSYVHDCWVWARDRHRFIMCRHPCLPSSLNEETFVTNKTHQEEREKVKLCVCLGNPSPLLPTMQLSTVKMEGVNVGTVSPGGGKLDIATKDVPVVHTEIKTITYESSQVRLEAWPLCGVMHSRVTTQ